MVGSSLQRIGAWTFLHGHNGARSNTSEELVVIDEDELQDFHDEAQEAALPVPVVVPENVPGIAVVLENMPVVAPEIDVVPENEPASRRLEAAQSSLSPTPP